MPVTIDNMDYLKIGEVAKLIGRSAQTIKRWEDTGKIPQSTRQKSNNWRIYSPSDVETIKSYSNSLAMPNIQTTLL